MVNPVRSNNTLSQIQQQNELEQRIISSQEVKILSEVFGEDVADILVNYALEHGLGPDDVLDRSDLLPDKVLNFLKNLAVDAEKGELENWRTDYESLWNSMSPEEKQLTLKLVEELLGESVDIEALITSSKTGVTEVKSAAEIQEILDAEPPGEYTFTFQGEEYTLSKQDDKYVCKDSEGKVWDSSVNFNIPPGWLKIVGLPGMDGTNSALFLGTHQGQMGMMEADKSLTGGYDALKTLLEEGTVLWTSGDTLVQNDSFSTCRNMSVKDIKAFIRNNGVYDFKAGGEEYRLSFNPEGDGKYELRKKDANGEWKPVEGADISVDAEDGVIEIGGLTADDESLYLFDNGGSTLSMGVGAKGLATSKLEEELLVVFNGDHADDVNPLNVQKNPASWEGVTEIMGIPADKIDPKLKEAGADVNWVETDEYAIAVKRTVTNGMEYFDTYVYDKDTGELVSKVWGDPHVQEHNNGDSSSFDFKGASTFILPDGTKINMQTSPYESRTVCTEVNICSGDSRVEFALDENKDTPATVTQFYDRYEWDAKTADAEEADGYVFALYSNDDSANFEWAVWDEELDEWHDVVSSQGDNNVNVEKGDADISAQIDEDAKAQMDDRIKEVVDERAPAEEEVEDGEEPALIGDTAKTEAEATDEALWTLFDKLAGGEIDADTITDYINRIYAYYDASTGQPGGPDQPDGEDPGYGINPWPPDEPAGTPWPENSTMNQWGVPNVAAHNMIPKWQNYVLKSATSGGPVDIYSLVMHVLRESYEETLDDLQFYAQKVQFYNQLKKEIRKELNAARKDLANKQTHEEVEFDLYPHVHGPECGCDPTVVTEEQYGDIMVVPAKPTGVMIDGEDKDAMDGYIKRLEEDLNSVGDDAQLANVDLQNWMQKQQQTIQLLSNVSKMLHDTAMSIIRKIG